MEPEKFVILDMKRGAFVGQTGLTSDFKRAKTFLYDEAIQFAAVRHDVREGPEVFIVSLLVMSVVETAAGGGRR